MIIVERKDAKFGDSSCNVRLIYLFSPVNVVNVSIFINRNIVLLIVHVVAVIVACYDGKTKQILTEKTQYNPQPTFIFQQPYKISGKRTDAIDFAYKINHRYVLNYVRIYSVSIVCLLCLSLLLFVFRFVCIFTIFIY